MIISSIHVLEEMYDMFAIVYLDQCGLHPCSTVSLLAVSHMAGLLSYFLP